MIACYACMVGVWTGPESHDEWCPARKDVSSSAVHHVIRVGSVSERTAWDCSCGRGGSVGEWGDVDLASDKHIDYANGDTRVNSSKHIRGYQSILDFLRGFEGTDLDGLRAKFAKAEGTARSAPEEEE